MKEYKRLTDKEYLNKPKCFNCEHNYSNCSTCECHCVDGDCFQLREELQRLVQLEDKIENGTLIELPCKVGDKVYQVVKGLPIYEWEVETIVFSNIYFPKNYVITARRIKDLAHWKFWCEDFGETLFLTKAKAEAKLKEQENER